MDESLSWRAKLAKSNINILDIHDNMVFLEFTYHPYSGGPFKWCKTVYPFREGMRVEDLAEGMMKEVLSLRKEMEG